MRKRRNEPKERTDLRGQGKKRRNEGKEERIEIERRGVEGRDCRSI